MTTGLKRCSKCGFEKPYNDFHRSARGLNGFRADCKNCRFIKKHKEITPDGTRRCITCHEIKNINYFAIRTDTKTTRSQCKTCRSKWNLAYYKTNKKRCNDYKKTWVQRNQDQHRMACAKWAKNNRAKLNKKDSARRALELNCQPSWLSAVELAQIQEMYDVAMAKTIQTGIRHEVDHVHPLSGGQFNGLHVPWNLQIMTLTENRAKKNKFPADEAHLFWRHN